MTEKRPSGTLVSAEIRGRITDKIVFELICKAADADFGCKKGAVKELLLDAIRNNTRAIINGYCDDGKPLRLTDIVHQCQVPLVVVAGREKGKNYGETYCVNPRWGIGPILPMTVAGPAITADVVNNMLKKNPFGGLEEISRSLTYYNAENYPSFTMPRSLQVALMPDEKIGLLAGIRR